MAQNRSASVTNFPSNFLEKRTIQERSFATRYVQPTEASSGAPLRNGPYMPWLVMRRGRWQVTMYIRRVGVGPAFYDPKLGGDLIQNSIGIFGDLNEYLYEVLTSKESV